MSMGHGFRPSTSSSRPLTASSRPSTPSSVISGAQGVQDPAALLRSMQVCEGVNTKSFYKRVRACVYVYLENKPALSSVFIDFLLSVLRSTGLASS